MAQDGTGAFIMMPVIPSPTETYALRSG